MYFIMFRPRFFKLVQPLCNLVIFYEVQVKLNHTVILWIQAVKRGYIHYNKLLVFSVNVLSFSFSH